MSVWDNRKASAIDREKASQRLDCFLSVTYLFPNCLDVQDTDLLAKRENELDTIYKYSGRGFLAAYGVSVIGYYALRRGSLPYFKDTLKHGVLGVGGTFVFARMAEKIAAEMYYNKVMI